MMAEELFPGVPLKKRKLQLMEESTPEVVSLRSTELLLHVPAHINTSLPVWESVQLGQVEVVWNVSPHCINIRLSPYTASSDRVEPPSSALPELVPLTVKPLNASVFLDKPPQIIHSPVLSQTWTQTVIQPPNTSQLQSLSQPVPTMQGTVPGSSTDLKCTSVCQPLPREQWVEQAYFYTRPSSSIHICDDFLLGRCSRRSECTQHHTPFPFFWQLKRRDTGQWVSVSNAAQLKLERLYCGPDHESIQLREMTEEFTLNFENMLIENTDKYNEARRLSNTRDPKQNPYFSMEWKIFWNDDVSWQLYKSKTSKKLIEKMVASETRCQFSISNRKYEVNFVSMTQENLATGYTRRMRLRPNFHSPLSIRSHLKTVILSETLASSSEIHPNLNNDPLKEFDCWYPPVWTSVPDDGFSIVEVPYGVEAFVNVYSLFHKTICETQMEIVSIHQVQNVFQWDKYRRQKEHMRVISTEQGGTSVLERHLFHGTTKDSAWDICRNNFDPRVSGKNGVLYGHGTYFAKDASYSNDYTHTSHNQDCRHMFLAKVLVGSSSVGKRNYFRPPFLKRSQEGYKLYDSCVNQKANPSIFVVFDSCQCYPYYLIKYKKLSNVVNVFE